MDSDNFKAISEHSAGTADHGPRSLLVVPTAVTGIDNNSIAVHHHEEDESTSTTASGVAVEDLVAGRDVVIPSPLQTLQEEEEHQGRRGVVQVANDNDGDDDDSRRHGSRSGSHRLVGSGGQQSPSSFSNSAAFLAIAPHNNSFVHHHHHRHQQQQQQQQQKPSSTYNGDNVTPLQRLLYETGGTTLVDMVHQDMDELSYEVDDIAKMRGVDIVEAFPQTKQKGYCFRLVQKAKEWVTPTADSFFKKERTINTLLSSLHHNSTTTCQESTTGSNNSGAEGIIGTTIQTKTVHESLIKARDVGLLITPSDQSRCQADGKNELTKLDPLFLASTTTTTTTTTTIDSSKAGGSDYDDADDDDYDSRVMMMDYDDDDDDDDDMSVETEEGQSVRFAVSLFSLPSSSSAEVVGAKNDHLANITNHQHVSLPKGGGLPSSLSTSDTGSSIIDGCNHRNNNTTPSCNTSFASSAGIRPFSGNSNSNSNNGTGSGSTVSEYRSVSLYDPPVEGVLPSSSPSSSNTGSSVAGSNKQVNTTTNSSSIITSSYATAISSNNQSPTEDDKKLVATAYNLSSCENTGITFDAPEKGLELGSSYNDNSDKQLINKKEDQVCEEERHHHQQQEALRTLTCLFHHENPFPQPVVSEILELLKQFPKLASRKYIFQTCSGAHYRAATCLMIFIWHNVGDDSLDRCIKFFSDRKKTLQQTIRDLWKLNNVPKPGCSADYHIFNDDGGLIWLMKECHKHEIDPSQLISFILTNQAMLNKKGNRLSVVETFCDLDFNPRPAVNLDLQFDVTLIPSLILCGDKLNLTCLKLTKMEEFDTPTTRNMIELINIQQCLQKLAIDGTFDFDKHWVAPFCDALATNSFRLRTLNLTGGYINLSWREHQVDHYFSQLVRKSSSLVNLNVIGVRDLPRVSNGEKPRRLLSGLPNLEIIASDLTPCLVDICCFHMYDAKPAMQKWSQCKNNWSASCTDRQLGIIDSESLVKAILDLQQLCPSDCQCSLPKDIQILLKEYCGIKSQDEPMIVLFNLIYCLLGKNPSLWSSSSSGTCRAA